MKPISPIKGMRDFYPAEMQVRSWLYQTIRRVSESFGYQEYEGPLLESLDLYAAKSGEELVREQAFSFIDRSGDWIALRPELTPTLARMVAQRQRELVFPLRWWSYGPMWRYEQPQKGRTREFFQWNIDLIGAQSPEADAELVAIGAAFFRETGLAPDHVQILVNDRSLIGTELERLGIPQTEQRPVLRLIDRREKMSAAAWKDHAQEIGLRGSQIDALGDVLQDNELWRQSEELCRVFAAVEAFGVADYVRFAPHIVRGLDYYTGTVFEAWDQDGEFRSILGGGRYDNLVADVGGEPVGGVGFAMGDVVTGLVLAKFGCVPSAADVSSTPVLVTVFDEQHMRPSLRLAADLRAHGFAVACYPQPDKLRKQFRYADRIGVPVTVVIGPDELARDQVTLRDLRTGTQATIARADVPSRLHYLLDGKPKGATRERPNE
jgi:histidyl-tRNA synthetase